MGAELIPMAFTTGWGSGINAYAVVLVLGLADKVFHLSQIPNALARTDVLVGAGILFVLEMFADKIPYIDSAWDSVHTVVKAMGMSSAPTTLLRSRAGRGCAGAAVARPVGRAQVQRP